MGTGRRGGRGNWDCDGMYERMSIRTNTHAHTHTHTASVNPLPGMHESLPGFSHLYHRIILIILFSLYSTTVPQWLSSSGKCKRAALFYRIC